MSINQGFWLAEIKKLPKKTARNVTETTFLALFSPFFYPLPLDMAKFRHCSMRQSKVRAENAQHARDLVVNHLGCDIWDMRKFVFYPKKYSRFHHFIYSTYSFPFIDCLLLLFNVFYHRSDRESPTAAAFAAVLNMSLSGHVDK